MSLSDHLNQLIDERLFEEAASFLLGNPSALSPPHCRNLNLLIQSCFKVKEPELAAQLVEQFWSLLVGTSELRLAVTGLMRAGRLDLAQKVVLKAISSGAKVEAKLYEAFIEGALEAKAGTEALTVLRQITAQSLPESANLLQLAIRAFLKTFDLPRAAETLPLLPALSEQLWTDFLSACLQHSHLSLALQLLERLSADPAAPSWLWNLTLERLSQRLMPVLPLETALEAIPVGRKIWLRRVTLSKAVSRLMKAGRTAAGYGALYRFKGAVSSITLTKVIRLLLDKGDHTAVLEIVELLRKGHFKRLDIRQLGLPVQHLKQLLSLQQVQLDLLGTPTEESDSQTQTSSDYLLVD